MRSILALIALSLVACDNRRDPMDDGGPRPMVDANLPPGSDAGPGTDAGPVGPTGPTIDPSCTDGMFSEALPTPDADIADLVAAYSASDPTSFIEASLARRYPTGRELVMGGRAGQDCVGIFLRDTSSAAAVIPQIGTVVHECGHFFDGALSSGSSNTYVINDAPTRITCDQGDTTTRFGLTFARSRIKDDEYAARRPPCDGTPGDCDFYADIYLDGDPDDATFEGGDQGFNMLFDELVQYVNSLATALAYTNELNTGGRRASDRDGLLTFLWYTMRYLRMARLEHPSAYAHLLSGDGACWRDAILTVWGRAWLYLEATDGMVHLGIDDAELMSLVEDPSLLEEIQRLRDAAGC